jgi:uncharacterized UBP type Zn finger protein
MPSADQAAEFPRLRSHPDRVYRQLRKAWTGTHREKPCTHLDQMRRVTPSSTRGCTDCLALGDTWPHLRICLICGYVGCCDMAKNQHMLRHYRETGHTLIQSFEEGEDWIWCYIDEALLVPPEVAPGG